MTAPSTNGDDGGGAVGPVSGGGRDGRGRFATGNPGGPGNPLGPAVAKLRAALIEAVTVRDIRAIAKGLVAKAREGDTLAARVLLGYTLGRPVEADLIERLESLEARAAALDGSITHDRAQSTDAA
ncbi:hypothetical protein RAS1_37900 [Phycisphaerae bacterium RAS1]|nr:hypothetical protein RAS1_37900 [Phycisphaerae bacterium RAS1]